MDVYGRELRDYFVTMRAKKKKKQKKRIVMMMESKIRELKVIFVWLCRVFFIDCEDTY